MKIAKKGLILFNAGMGDCLQMIPAWNYLHKSGWRLTGIFGAKYTPIPIIEALSFFEEIIIIENDVELLNISVSKIRHFEKAWIDFSSSSALWCLAGCIMAFRAITNRQKWYLDLLPNLYTRRKLLHSHRIFQNLNLVTDEVLKLNLKEITSLRSLYFSEIQPIIEGKYFIVQICSANNQVDYKNWPLIHWAEFLSRLSKTYPEYKIVLVGDEHEVEKGNKLKEISNVPLLSLIDQTSIVELTMVVKNAVMYIGLDSGTMHLAAMLGIPTFTLWGPTNPLELGYGHIFPARCTDVFNNLPCHPCLSNYSPNRSHVDHPSKCNHQSCIKKLDVEIVWNHFQKMMENKIIPYM
ncbi:MAG: hypothetical protein KatS3mg031_3132 [Chitinophagales bacterium]|nr:MAG: hypothetical protein KatS3mg031_3132 [Chitinophagales bacterium]